MFSHFEVNMRNHSQDIMKKQLYQQLTETPYKQALVSQSL